MTITLYELRGAEDRRFSLFSWRTRMALAHKGLTPRIETVAMHDKAALAFSGGTTVPVIRDRDTTVRDSWAIALHLERAYPDRASLFGGPVGEAVSALANAWADRSVVPLLLPAIAADIHDRVDLHDKEHVRTNFELFIAGGLEARRAERDASLPAIRRALEPARASLKDRPYLAGESPAYADYILFSVLQWARITSPWPILDAKDRIAPWFEHMLDLYDGLGRAAPAARHADSAAA